MTRQLPKVCANPTCHDLTDGDTYCTSHKPEPWAGSTRRQRLPADWNKKRRRILKRDGHRCQLRLEVCTIVATEVDHRQRGDNHSDANLQAACHSCHTAKTQQEAAQARKRVG